MIPIAEIPARIAVLALVVLLAVTARPVIAATPAPSLTTIAERSGNTRTGRYDEVVRLCGAYARRWPKQVRCLQFGRTPEGRPMLALVASGDGTLDPASAKARKRPVVLMQGGIHAGEIDGKDAGFRFLRDALTDKVSAGALSRLTLVFVPVFNVDGHERFGRWNRPNQVGPEESGWRATGQNLNLNRDYTKADATEMQAMLRLLGTWDPVVYVDLHVTDGADFEPDISITMEPLLGGDTLLTAEGQRLQDHVIAQISKNGSLPLSFYPNFEVDDDPASGFAVSVSTPRYSTGYWALHNRFAILVETHSWKPYAKRERATYQAIAAIVDYAARADAHWSELTTAADARSAALGGQIVPLSYENTDHVTMLDFRGYAYTRDQSLISGGIVTKYDSARPQIWRVPLKDQVRPALAITAPRGGYIVPAAHAAWVRDKLALHGIVSRVISTASASSPVEAFRATRTKWAERSFEGHVMLTVEGDWHGETRAIAAGSLFVPIAQANARLVMTLFEPKSPDSLASWGFFNSAFEQKEYMEAYVTERVAADMLQKDPALRAEFEKQLNEDAAFKSSPAQRLEFFYRRHPAWDERYNLYPVLRVDKPPR